MLTELAIVQFQTFIFKFKIKVKIGQRIIYLLLNFSSLASVAAALVSTARNFSRSSVNALASDALTFTSCSC